jgi:peptide deformylase
MSDFDLAQLKVITYPHPTLRYTAKPVRRVNAKLRGIIERMFELMYEHRGVGLAATQVDLPLRLFVMNQRGTKGEGEEVVMINPIISRPRGSEEEEEGCLSLPNVHGKVIRPKTIRVNAFDLVGNEINVELSGFEARIVQHETDHLNGTLFIDRLKEGSDVELLPQLDALHSDFRSQQKTGGLPADDILLARLSDWEQEFC